MTDIDRVKRRLLREAVQENLDTMRGLPRRVLRRRRRFALLGPGWLVLVPAALLGPSLVQPPADAPAAPVPAAAAPAPASPPVLPAPRPIDPAVFPLAVRRVVVDPGHGGASRGGIAPRGLLEKDLTLDIAERLERLLEAQAIDVVLTRRGDDSMALGERTAAAGRLGWRARWGSSSRHRRRWTWRSGSGFHTSLASSPSSRTGASTGSGRRTSSTSSTS